MKNLELNKMEAIEGGSCTSSAIGLGLAMVGATFITGGAAALVFAGAFIAGSISLADACK